MDISSTNDIMTLAALVAAYVGVAKSFGVRDRWTHLVALLVATGFVLAPEGIRNAVTTISVVGLTASGAYNYAAKKREQKGENG